MGPPIKDDISREKTILMTSLRTHRASAVSSPGLCYTYLPLNPCAIESSLCTLGGTRSQLGRELFKREKSSYRNHIVLFMLCRHALFHLH